MKQLNTLHEKIALLEHLGVDHLVVHPFDKEFSRLTAEDFVKQVLVDTFKLKKIIIGYDHRFGRNRTADINDLTEFGHTFGFEVAQISAKEINRREPWFEFRLFELKNKCTKITRFICAVISLWSSIALHLCTSMLFWALNVFNVPTTFT